MNRIHSFLRREPVFYAALVLSVCAVCTVRPSPTHIIHMIDFSVLSQLFCLMLVIQAFRSINVLNAAASSLLHVCRTPRAVYFVLTGLVFFCSMAVTNDVALLTFVPLSIAIGQQINGSSRFSMARLIILETLAANLGSCVTPMGNPQNLFLYAYYTMQPAQFFSATLKIGIPSLILLTLAIVWETRGNQHISAFKTSLSSGIHISSIQQLIVYTIVLAVLLLSVFRIIDYRIALAVTTISVLIFNYRLLARPDYFLLGTFAGFFIFTGCISSIPAVSGFLRHMLGTPLSVYITGILTSQIISNVPAALLLSGFTDNAQALLLGVNVGGLGTLIASLASLISYKLYTAYEQQTAGTIKQEHYLAAFTVYNSVFLVILTVIVYFCALKWL
jgi:Na+/H+ antiporter NhaD/arsenite permease-like protein